MRHFRTALSLPALSFSVLTCALARPLIAMTGSLQAGSTGPLTTLVAAKLIAAVTTSTNHTALAAESTSELSWVVFWADWSVSGAENLTLIRPACLPVGRLTVRQRVAVAGVDEEAGANQFLRLRADRKSDQFLDSGQES